MTASTAPDSLRGGARVAWEGDLGSGKGTLRFELGAGDELPLLWPGGAAYGSGATSPEELAAAAHAACFTMTLAHILARMQRTAQRIETSAETTFGAAADARKIRRSQLHLIVTAEGLNERELKHAVNHARQSCPVSNTFRAAGVEIVVEATLASA